MPKGTAADGWIIYGGISENCLDCFVLLQLYFVWVTASQKQFEWLIDILKNVEERDRKSIVETHIFITQLFHQFDLRTTMLVNTSRITFWQLTSSLIGLVTSLFWFICSTCARSTSRRCQVKASSLVSLRPLTSVGPISILYSEPSRGNIQRWRHIRILKIVFDKCYNLGT